ncbi:MAG: putrescine ABC transporter permease PotI [Deltaproteobacteria bacterium]|nr:MAG: putrescine ABC transporter permease PotI [Deltaproteobacteria bacterium]
MSAIRRSPLLNVWLVLGYAFLYTPIIILIVFSFNESKLVTVWAGFSTKWYGELLRDQQMLSAAWLSLRLALMSATGAVILGVLAGFVMARFGRFRGHNIFAGMITAPLVMPEVITGLSLLLLFVSMEKMLGWPSNRGMFTLWISHVTFCAAFVTVVITSRLKEMDASIEEAAMDLGAPPFKVFTAITLPIIAPAIASGWLLAFTLSLDDLVISSFVAGPGATTLPMKVFSSVRLGVSPKINALAAIVVGVVTLCAAVAGFFMLRTERNRKLEIQAAQRGTD